MWQQNIKNLKLDKTKEIVHLLLFAIECIQCDLIELKAKQSKSNIEHCILYTE